MNCNTTHYRANSSSVPGDPTYDGQTFVNAGTLIAAHANALGTLVGSPLIGNTVVAAGATLALSGGVTIAEPLSLDGTGAGATVEGRTGSNTLTGPMVFTGATGSVKFGATGSNTLTIGAAVGATNITMGNCGLTGVGAGTTIINSVIANNAVTMNGAGKLVLNATNTYAGNTTVNSGILEVDGSNTGTGVVSVGSAGTLAGTGTIAGLVNSNGTVSPGSSPGILNLAGSLDLRSTGTLSAEANTTTAGTGYDQVNVTGTVTLGNTGANAFPALVFTPGAVFSGLGTPDSFAIISNDGTDAIVGHFAGLAEGQLFTAAGQTFRITYTGEATDPSNSSAIGNDVVVRTVFVPPPVYVDDDWAGFTDGQAVTDVDPVTPGNQPGIYGSSAATPNANAFSSVTQAILKSSVAANGSIIVNPGVYHEAVNVNSTSIFILQQGGTEPGTITFDSIASPASGVSPSIQMTNNVNLIVGDSSSTTLNHAIQGVGSLTKVGTGTLTLSAANGYNGTTTISAGAIRTGIAGALPGTLISIGPAGKLQLGGISQSFAAFGGTGIIENASATPATLTVGAGDGDSAFSGGFQDGAGGGALSLTKVGTGTFTLAGVGLNTYTGATNVNVGKLRAGASGVFSTASLITIASGAKLQLGGFDNTLGSLSGPGIVEDGASVNATLTLNVTADTTVSNLLQNGAGAGLLALNKAGGAILTLANANTYTGGSTISAGIVHPGVAGTILGLGGLNVTATGTLQLVGLNVSVGAISGSGVIENVSTTNDATLTIAIDGGTSTFGGTIRDGAGTKKLSLSMGVASGIGGVDNFATAVPFTTQFITATGSNVGFTTEAGEPNPINPPTPFHTVWWRWTAPQSGTIAVSLQGSSFDTTLGVFTGSAVNALTLIASNDDLGTTGTAYVTQSYLTFSATAGVTYSIQVDGYSAGDTGNIVFRLTPTNGGVDNFASAVPFTSQATTARGSNAGFTAEAGEPNPNVPPTAFHTAWWRWTAPQDGTTTVSLQFSSFDTTLGVFTGNAVNALTLIANNDDFFGTQSFVTFTATAGVTYSIQVDGYPNTPNVGDTGDIFFSLTQAVAPALPGNVTLTGNNSYTGTTTVAFGTLVAGSDNALGATTAGTTVSFGATLGFSGGANVNGEAIIANGTGAAGQPGAIVNVSGVNSYTGPITAQDAANGTLGIGSSAGTLTLNGTINLRLSSLILDGAGNVVVNSTISSNASAVTNTVTKQGAGKATLAGANTYNGQTFINSGTLVANNVNALGTTSANTVVAPGGTLEINSTTAAMTEPVVIDGLGAAGEAGALTANGGSFAYAGALTIAPSTNPVSIGNLAVGTTFTLPSTALASLPYTKDITFTGPGNTTVPGPFGHGASVNVTGLAGQLILQTGLGVDTEGGIASILGTTPDATAPLLEPLNFPQDSDAHFNTFFGGPPGAANFTALFTGTFTAPVTGSYHFGISGNDDTAALWVDSDQNSIFEQGNRIAQAGCCNGDPNTDGGSVTLTAGQTYNVAFVVEDTGGASGLVVHFTVPGGVDQLVDPSSSGQVGYWGGATGAITPHNNVAKTGSGTVTFGSANTYNGNTTVSGGTLVTLASEALGTGPNRRLIVSGAGTTVNLFDSPTAITTVGTADFTAGQGVVNTGQGKLALQSLVLSDGSSVAGNFTAQGSNLVVGAVARNLTAVSGDLTITGYDGPAATIALVDGPSPFFFSGDISGNPSQTVSAPFTVTGGSILIANIGLRDNNPTPPNDVNWNGQQMTLAVFGTHAPNNNFSRDSSIWYLFNPTPGTGTISVTGATTNNTAVWISAFTLSGVNTERTPITASSTMFTGNGIAPPITLNGVRAGSWIDVAEACFPVGESYTWSGPGLPAITNYREHNSNLNTSQGAGTFQNVAAGNYTITGTMSNPGPVLKSNLMAAAFGPATPTVLNYPLTNVTLSAGSNLKLDSTTAATLGNVTMLGGNNVTVGVHPAPSLTVASISGNGTVSLPLTVTTSTSPGLSAGTINTGNVTLSPGSTFSVDINGTTAGTQYDQLVVTGTATLTGTSLSIDVGTFNPVQGSTYTIINSDHPIVGTFTQGSTITAGGRNWTINYAGGSDGDDVVLTAGAAATNGALQLSAATYTVAEGQGFATYTITRTGGTSGAVSVQVTTADGTATSPADYAGGTQTVNFINGQASATFTVAIVDDNIAESNETFTVTLSNPTGGATLGTQTTATTTITDPLLVVTSVTPTLSGFVVRFNRAFDVAPINLYNAIGSNLGAADVQWTGPGKLSLITDPVDKNMMTLVQTGGPVTPGTYNLTIKSGSTAFRAKDLRILDGDNNGVAGADYTSTVTFAPLPNYIVSIPDFARGEGQTGINIPNDQTNGIPLRINTPSGATSFQADIVYNPALLTITGAAPSPAAAAAGYTVTFTGNVTSPPAPAGMQRARVVLSGGGSLGNSANFAWAFLTASVPSTATRTSKEVLTIENVLVNGSAAGGDSGVHVVGWFGDANANKTKGGDDATLVAQVAADLGSSGTDTFAGFAAYQNADPGLIANIDYGAFLDAADATRVAQWAADLPSPLIPDLTNTVPSVPTGGPDPRLYLPTITAAPGQTVTVALRFEALESGVLTSADLALLFDASRFQVSNVRLSSNFSSNFAVAPNVDNLHGSIRAIVFTGGLGQTFTVGQDMPFLLFDVTVGKDAASGTSALNLAGQVGNVRTNLNGGNLILTPAPTNGFDAGADGSITVMATSKGGNINYAIKSASTKAAAALLPQLGAKVADGTVPANLATAIKAAATGNGIEQFWTLEAQKQATALADLHATGSDLHLSDADWLALASGIKSSFGR